MSSNIINPRSLSDFAATFVQTVQAESTNLPEPLLVTPGSVIGALGNASAINASYLQGQAQSVGLASRLLSCVGNDVDTWVEQFSPPFVPRLPAIAANDDPTDPTTLAAAAQNTYLLVASSSELLVGQNLSLTTLGGKSATTAIVTNQPTVLLTSPVNQGDTAIHVVTTNGMIVGGTLTLVDGNFSVNVVVTGITSGFIVAVTAVNGLLSHTYAVLTTVVQLINLLVVSALVFAGGSVLADFVSGSALTPLNLLGGLRFFRKVSSPSTPTIVIGTLVQDQIQGVQYQVVADASNPNYDPILMRYTLGANLTEVYVACAAVTPGIASNVSAHQLTVTVVAITGIDGVDNNYAIANGVDIESDDALKLRFQLFMQSLANGQNLTGIEVAISGVQALLQFLIKENVAVDGSTPDIGNILIIVSDQFGNLSTDLYNRLYIAVDNARPVTSTFNIIPPVVLQPTIVMQVTIDPTKGNPTATRAAIQLAIFNSFVGSTQGAELVFTELLRIAQDFPAVTEVLELTVNGNGFTNFANVFVQVGSGNINVIAGPLQFIKPQIANITIS